MSQVKIEDVPCAFCGSNDKKKYDSLGEWSIVECNNCSFLFTSPQPTPDSLASFYSEEYFKDERHFDKFYNEDGTLKDNQESYTNRIEDIETHFNERGSLLEIGSARGFFLDSMKQRGWFVNGVEISEDASAIANKSGIETFVGDYLDSDLERKYDAICLYQTLEHVPNPKGVIEKAFKELNDGGIFVAEIPNVNCSESKISKTRKRLSYDLPRHLNHFTPDFLEKEFKKAGFEVISIERYPPKFLLKLLALKGKLKKSSTSSPSGEVGATETKVKSIPLSRKLTGKKASFIAKVSKVFPGWRFTITGRKNPAIK